MSDLRRARFARLVRNALDELPAEFRERIRNLEIVIEDEPAPEQVPEGGTQSASWENPYSPARERISDSISR